MLPRLYRQAPLNSIWEGSGNIQCLDVLRALQREPMAMHALREELLSATGRHPAYDAWTMAVTAETAALAARDADAVQAGARALVERLALALQAAVLLRAGSPSADAFCRSRLGGARGMVFGTLTTHDDIDGALARIAP
jgi:putative acyl-CoA dehydrogenase